ncbi:MAG: rRNA maturation RNase YbeY [Clostridiales bacterium]|nr:rRNA maturation RNase YbeY [Clostridiales bacterium]
MIELFGASLFEKRIIKKVYAAYLKRFGLNDCLTVEIGFYGEDDMRELNNRTRGIDKVTDVLSYPAFEGRWIGDFDKNKKENIHIGSIVICRQKAKQQAADYGHSYKREIGFLTAHGLLHLSGYDHMTEDEEKEMIGLQKEILSGARLKR